MALFAFASILETRHHQQLLTTVTQSLEMISNFLCDNNTPDHLKEVSGWLWYMEWQLLRFRLQVSG